MTWGFFPVLLLLFGEAKRRQKQRVLAARELLAAKRQELELAADSPHGRARGFIIPVHEDAAARRRLEAEVSRIDAWVRADQSLVHHY